MNVYLDIDGVLLKKDKSLPKHASELITFVVENYGCFWLTTHCRTGTNKAIEYLSKYYPSREIKLLEKVKPTNWNTLKTEGIDFKSDFVWLEDNCFESEKKILLEKDLLESLVEIDLKLENELKRVIKTIRQKTK